MPFSPLPPNVLSEIVLYVSSIYEDTAVYMPTHARLGSCVTKEQEVLFARPARNLSLVSKQLYTLSQRHLFKYIDINSPESYTQFVLLVRANDSLLSFVREFRLAKSIQGDHYWNEEEEDDQPGTQGITLGWFLARMPNLRCWSSCFSSDTTSFLSTYISLLLPTSSQPQLTALLGISVSVESLPIFISYLSSSGTHLQKIQLAIQVPYDDPTTVAFTSFLESSSPIIHLPQLHTFFFQPWNGYFDPQPILEFIAQKWQLPSLRQFSFGAFGFSLFPEALLKAHGSNIEEFSWTERNPSSSSLLPHLYLLPKMKNLRCRPFSFEEGVAADGLKNVKWLVVEYDEKDRDAGAGFVEEFLDSIGKEKWESLEAVLWRSGEGEGDVWKSMIPRLKKLKVEEEVWTFWV